MKRFNFIGYISLLLLLGSCEKFIFSDPGELQQRKVSYDYFSQISIYKIFDVELSSDTVFSIEIVTNEKYIENISLSLDSNSLMVTDDNQYKWFPDYPRPKLKISFPKLDGKILLYYPVNMTTSDTIHLPKLRIISLCKAGDFDLLLNVDYFELTTGSDNYGTYICRGRARNSRLWPRGSSIVDASELQTNTCYVYNNSIGDCWVNVTERLEARLNTMGNVYYYGDPAEIVIVEESGSGRLIEVE